jgi:hypothetical protein
MTETKKYRNRNEEFKILIAQLDTRYDETKE